MKIELTVIDYTIVLIPLSVIGAIVFPSLISSFCGNYKISEPEGEHYTTTIARVQQAHYVEFGSFTKELSMKMFGVPKETNNYQYSMIVEEGEVIISGQTKNKELHSYRGYVWLDDKTDGTMMMVCATQKPGMPAQVAVRDVRNFNKPCEFNRRPRC